MGGQYLVGSLIVITAEEFLGWCREQVTSGLFPAANLGLRPEQVKAVIAVQMAMVPVYAAEKDAAREAEILSAADALTGVR